ncbi:MAG: RluA family pseudouridine synthase [Chloroflexi bacterium]|nr:RluA family pseudouridine synthase [Chloroflexota bacterium]
MTDRLIRLIASSTGERIDRYLALALPELSRAQIQRLIDDGFITVNNIPVAKASQRLNDGDEIAVTVPPPAPATLAPESIPLAIVYEDGDLIVIDKPAGMVAHPAAGHPGGTLVNAVLAHAPDLEGVGDEQRPGIVHRLDRDTSGLIVVAKNNRAHRHLQKQFKDRAAQKLYLALVVGKPPTPTGRIEAAIDRDPKNRQRMAVTTGESGREAVTVYRTVEAFKQFTLVEAEPKTGRTHQIRVHLTFIGCPIAGDSLYSTPRSVNTTLPGLHRQFLHAARLTIALPSGAVRTFDSPLPEDLSNALTHLRSI